MRTGCGPSAGMRAGRRALVTAGLAAPFAARAQAAWPDKPIRLVVGYAAGGPTDFVARLIQEPLQAMWGQPVVIENRGGANATIATEAVARAAPDGHTLLLAANNHVMNPPLYAKLPYDPVADFAPVHGIAVSPNVLWCGTQQPWQSLADFVAAAKARPGALGFATTGIGGNGHYGGELLQRALGIALTHVPYKGTAPAMQDVVAGLVPVTVGTLVGTLGGFRNGQIRPLAVLSPQRAPELPEVPTLAELGHPLVDTGVWYGLLAPAATPKPVVAKLAEEAQKAIRSPEFKKRMAEIGAEPVGSTPEQAARLIKDDTERFAKLVKQANVVLD